MKSTSNWMVAKPTGATTTNTAPSLASFFTPTEYVSAEEKQLEGKKYSERKKEVKEGAFIIPSALFYQDLCIASAHIVTERDSVERGFGSFSSNHLSD